jgi:hypothetical protein
MEKKKMKFVAFAKLLNKKINSANRKAKNPFMDGELSLNPFNRQFYNTLVWIEPEDKLYTSYKRHE